MKVQVKAFPRIHMSLADLSSVSLRRFGGAGVVVGGLPTMVYASTAARFSLVSSCHLDVRTMSDLEGAISALKKISGSSQLEASVRIDSDCMRPSERVVRLGPARRWRARNGRRTGERSRKS